MNVMRGIIRAEASVFLLKMQASHVMHQVSALHMRSVLPESASVILVTMKK